MPIEKGCTHCGSDQHNTTECPMRDAAPAGEREAFEIWARKPDNGTGKLDLRLCDIGLYYRRETGTAWDGFQAGAAWQRAQSAGVPEGERIAELLESVRMGDDEAKPHGSGATYWNNAVIACQVAIRDALAASPAPEVPVPNDDQLALDAATDIMALMYGPTPAGGSVQLKAQVQCRVLDAINAAPQPVPQQGDEVRRLRAALEKLRAELDSECEQYDRQAYLRQLALIDAALSAQGEGERT